jgi:hypothetical protein
MNRNIIIGVIVVVIIAVAAWFIFSPQASTETSSSVTSVSTSTSEVASSSSPTSQGTTVQSAGTLRALVTQGGNYTCTLTTTAQSGNGTRGTIYAAGGKTRLDFVFQGSNGVDTTTHIIRNGTYAYTWVDGQTLGTRTPITASSPIVPEQPQGGVIAVADNLQISSDCRPWVPDASQFVPPTAITFSSAN